MFSKEKDDENVTQFTTIFKCLHCPAKFLKSRSYENHIRVKHESLFVCELCGYAFITEKSCSLHKMNKHDTINQTLQPEAFTGPYCDVCDVKFLTEEAYERHLKRSSKHNTASNWGDSLQDVPHEVAVIYQCPYCPAAFDKKISYTGHMRIKHESSHVCELCGYTFISEAGVDMHKKKKHLIADATMHAQVLNGPHCDVCNVTFLSEGAYNRHLQRSSRHKNNYTSSATVVCESLSPQTFASEQEIVCELCGFGFASTRGLNLHKNVKHADEKSIEMAPDSPYCDVCDVGFVSMDAFNQHLKLSARHSDHQQTLSVVNITNVFRTPRKRKRREPVVCEQCDMVFNDARKYHGHFMAAHPDKNRTKFASTKTPCMCEVCGRIFQCFAALRDHRWLHTGERNFKCEVCDKSFRTKYVLMLHKRLHSKNRPSYPCPTCGKHYSSSANRLKHTFIHTGLKPYECEKCGKKFRFRSDRKVHNEYVHLKKPWPKRDRSKRKRFPIIYNHDLQHSNKILEDEDKIHSDEVDYDDNVDDELQNNIDDEAEAKSDINEMDGDRYIVHDDALVAYEEVEIDNKVVEMNNEGVEIQYVDNLIGSDEVEVQYNEDFIGYDEEAMVKYDKDAVMFGNEAVEVKYEEVVHKNQVKFKYNENEVSTNEKVVFKYHGDDMDDGNTIHVKIKQDETDVDKIKLEIKQHSSEHRATYENDDIPVHSLDLRQYNSEDQSVFEVDEIKSEDEDKVKEEVIPYEDVYRMMIDHDLVSKEQFNDDEPIYIIIKS